MARKKHRNPYRMSEDKVLVERMLAGDESAFGQFLEDYAGGLFRFALTRLRHDEELAEEIVQSTVCIAIEQLDNYRGEAALMSWLCGICRHQISAHVRRKQRWGTPVELVEETPEIRAALEVLAAGLEGPEARLQRQDLVRLVHLTLDHLPARYGRALEWKYFDSLPVKEIAARLEIGPKAAESVLSRAREAFRNGFEALAESLDSGGPHGLRLTTAKRSG